MSPNRYEKTKLQPAQVLSMLEPLDDIKKYIQDTFEYYFISVQFDPEQNENGNYFKKVGFRISLQNEPTIILPILAKIKNLVIDRCIFDVANGTWEVKGTFWGK